MNGTLILLRTGSGQMSPAISGPRDVLREHANNIVVLVDDALGTIAFASTDAFELNLPAK